MRKRCVRTYSLNAFLQICHPVNHLICATFVLAISKWITIFFFLFVFVLCQYISRKNLNCNCEVILLNLSSERWRGCKWKCQSINFVLFFQFLKNWRLKKLWIGAKSCLILDSRPLWFSVRLLGERDEVEPWRNCWKFSWDSFLR